MVGRMKAAKTGTGPEERHPPGFMTPAGQSASGAEAAEQPYDQTDEKNQAKTAAAIDGTAKEKAAAAKQEEQDKDEDECVHDR